MRGRIAFGVLVAVIANTMAAVPTAASSPVHVLKGMTRITASTTSSTLVRFPKKIDFFKEFRPSHSGNGRVKGFIMRKSGTYRQEGSRPVIRSLALGECDEPGCKAAPNNPPFIAGFNVDRYLSGTWRLYVIADGAPVTVKLKLKGVSGARKLGTTTREKSEVVTLQPTIHESAANTVYSAGDFTELAEADFGMVGLWLEGGPHLASAFGSCLYHEQEEGDLPHPPRPAAFLPGCPTADGFSDVWPNPAGRAGVIFTSGAFCCPVGLGGWYASTAPIDRYGAVALWLDF